MRKFLSLSTLTKFYQRNWIKARKPEVLILLGAPDKPCGVGRADANPKLLLNDT